MNLLFVVQRYGKEVLGGAEAHARELATRLAARGHLVEVVTSCAVDYVTWANAYPAGSATLDGVLVHRLPVAHPRRMRTFRLLDRWVHRHPEGTPPPVQRLWMRQQGPYLKALPGWLRERAGRHDASVFFTYLYYTTWAGLPAAGRPIVLHPTAHDEPPFRLSLFERVFRLPDAYVLGSEEEAALVRGRSSRRPPSLVAGIGVEVDPPGDPASFRRRFGLAGRPYVVYAGRVAVDKGAVELFEHFTEYKRRRPGPLALVLIGKEIVRLPPHPDVVRTGFVDAETKDGGLRGAEVLIQPSLYESFSMVLHEAWGARVPALVQARCEVLAAQSRRSGAGLPYGTYPEFECELDRLLGEPALRRRMGEAGRAFVERHYAWPALISRYEAFLESLGSHVSDNVRR